MAVRDLSRFSRNYIDAGRYIQQIFPALGVRFISVLENMDFLTAPKHNDLLMLGVKNIFNEAYIRSLSRNIQSSLQYGYAAGKYLGAFAPYGYMKSPADKYRLESDPVTAPVVKRLYQWKMEGMSVAAMAEELQELNIPSPAEYKKYVSGVYCTGFQKSGVAKWTPITAIRILSNRVYTGRLEQGKTQKLYFKAQKRTKTLESQWVCTENAHEAIIPPYQFEAVQRLLLMDTKSLPGEKSVAPLVGFVRCKQCGGNMAVKQNCCPKRKYYYYVCNGKNEAKARCPAYRISKPVLEKEVFQQIKRRIEKVAQIDNIIQSLDMAQLHRLKNEEMTRPMLAYLVEKIVVGQDKKVEVKFVHEREYGLLKKVIE